MLLTVDLERLEIEPGQLLLDAGCGEGRHCFGAIDRGANVVGLDLDLPSVAPHTGRLNDTLAKQGARGGFLQGNTFALPFADGTFDRVICAEVMEHVHD